MNELGLTHSDGRFNKLMSSYGKADLSILDGWCLAPSTESQRRDMLELLDDNCGSRSMQVTSQISVSVIGYCQRSCSVRHEGHSGPG